ncbi:MAG: DNA polymerase III subunit alpha [Rhodospirillaceae bacterium]|nr:DNA polymerase III subunit alpha [Rhodospirillaceae bacterium]
MTTPDTPFASPPAFIHHRVRSAYSLCEGAIKPYDLVKLCVKHGLPAVTIMDRGNLFGALELAGALSDAGIQPIMGCELMLASANASASANTAAATSENSAAAATSNPSYAPIGLIALNEVGYQNLMALASLNFTAVADHQPPHITESQLAAHSEGLALLTGTLDGALSQLLLNHHADEAAALLSRLAGYFPDRLYVELNRHGLASEHAVEDDLIQLAESLNLPLLASNDVYFADPDDFAAHEVLLAIGQGVTISQPQRRRLTPEHCFKSPEAMATLFADLPAALANTVALAQRCHAFPTPAKPMLPSFPDIEPGMEDAHLRAVANAGLQQRLAAVSSGLPFSDYQSRLDYELAVISNMGFSGYFLIVADFIRWAKQQDIPVGPGRGSGAGSVVAWTLGITEPDPLEHGLLFERFLNPERVSLPDFDIDFCQHRRDEVIAYVRQKYGHERVANIITFGKLQARAVIRDVGRVLELPYSQVDRIAKMVPNNPANPLTLQQAMEGDDNWGKLRQEDATVDQLLTIALKLEGLYRHASTHAAGVVIANRPLQEIVPLYRDPRSGGLVTQYSMKYAEAAGLLKFDFLGLKTLTSLTLAQKMLTAAGHAVDLNHLPYDDPTTYRLLGDGLSAGVFQLESAGMRDTLRNLKPDRFSDIVAVLALYRPGPMANIPRYIACKHGQESPDYLHPSLQPILEETFGILVYQEQIMQIAQVLAGYSLGGADLLRRAMGKKIKAEMAAQEETFVKGAVANNVPASQAADIFQLVAKFAEYGFNKPHAVAYAVIAYQTAFLKANYPAYFFAAQMSLDAQDTDALAAYVQEMRDFGVRLLPPDVNRSGGHFLVETTAEGQAVRYGLTALKGLGESAVAKLVAERATNGDYRSLADFCQRLSVAGSGGRVLNKRLLEALIAAGACDSLTANSEANGEANRATLWQQAEPLMRWADGLKAGKATGQNSLFGGVEGGSGGANAAAPPPNLPTSQPWNAMESLTHEFEALGLYLSAHPLDSYQGRLNDAGIPCYTDFVADPQAFITTAPPATGKNSYRQNRDASTVTLAGVILSRKDRKSAKGNRFSFIQLSDRSAVFEVIAFSDLLSQHGELLSPGQLVLLKMTTQQGDDGGLRLAAQEVQPIESLPAKLAAPTVTLPPLAATTVGGLIAQLRGVGRGKTLVIATLLLDDYWVTAELGRFHLTQEQSDSLLAWAASQAPQAGTTDSDGGDLASAA